MSTVIHDTTIITSDPERRIYFRSAIAVENDRIAAIGPNRAVLERFPTAERIDGRGKAVMPGFANCHTHLNKTIARGIYEDLSTPNAPPFPPDSPLKRLPLPKLSTEERALMVRLGALEMIRSGTTLALEDGIGLAPFAQMLSDTGLRLVLSERASDRAEGGIGEQGTFVVNPELAAAGLQRIADLHAKWHGAENGRITVAVAGHAPDMCSPDLLVALRNLQERLDTIATIHLNQIWGEVAAVKANRGLLPTEYLHRHGFLNDRLIAAHCRCMTPEEESLLGAAKVVVCFNSAMAARRGLSCHALDLEASGSPICLGSDNMAEDMVEVMRTAMFMERVRINNGRIPTPEDVLQWATINGYRALEIPDAGCLKAGNKADLIVINIHQAHLVPTLRIVSSFVHNGQARDVEAVMVDGRWLMRDNRVLTMNEAEIVSEAERIGRRAWRRLLDEFPDLKPPVGFDAHTQ